MTEIRGEAVHVRCPENLKVWERKEIKDNYQAVQTDKNERLHGFFCIHVDIIEREFFLIPFQIIIC